MSARRAAASERRKSIEARTVDTEMRNDADGGSDFRRDVGTEKQDSVEGNGKGDVLQLIHSVSTFLCSVKENGEELATSFQRIPNRRVFPDYFEIISDPVAFSTVRSKVQKKQYISFSEFVKDVARICHNAQFYNRPSAPIFGAAVRLRDVFRDELKKLVDKGDISASDATIPDLGEIPQAEESSSRESEVGGVDGEEDDGDEGGGAEGDDDDEEAARFDMNEAEGSDEQGGSRLRRQWQRHSSKWRSTTGGKDRDPDMDDDSYKKSGRRPMMLTPTEARIVSVLEGLEKIKDQTGDVLISPFEKLPGKASATDYYHIVTKPIALDNIKKKARRRKFRNVEDLLIDIELMFENAKLHSKQDSEVFRAAVELQRQARLLAEQEKNRPDDEFRDEDGILTLSEVLHQGQIWRLGDWVHIRNLNDLAKPIVAQIFRIWQDGAGLEWINACWYYRPEQTVHRHDKYFLEREVVKTGQYRDHHIADVLDRCFVMSFTRFSKGRPRGFPPDKDVYVCESRYNEEQFRFNKIRTWASCLPDEVREKDYDMDLFDVPRRMKNIPSPIKHLLRENAKETDELPRPIWGSPNAPPIIGAVHRRLPEPNESPPPEPMPPPPPAPLVVDARSSIFPGIRDGAAEASARVPFQGPGIAPNSSHYNHGYMAPHFPPTTPAAGVQTPVPIPNPPHHFTPAPPHILIRPLQYQHPHQNLQHHPLQIQQHHPPASYAQNLSSAVVAHQQHLGTPNNSHVQLPQPARAAFASVNGTSAPHVAMFNPSRASEVYTLADNTNEALPAALRHSFQRDDAGRIMFFTAPPLDHHHKGLSPGSAGFGHSVRYLAGRKVWLAERGKKRKWRDGVTHDQERTPRDEPDATKAADVIVRQAANAMNQWFHQLDDETHSWRRDAGLQGWTRL